MPRSTCITARRKHGTEEVEVVVARRSGAVSDLERKSTPNPLLTDARGERPAGWFPLPLDVRVGPEDSEGFATSRDENVWACFREILGMPNTPPEANVIATVALSQVGSDWPGQSACFQRTLGELGGFPPEEAPVDRKGRFRSVRQPARDEEPEPNQPLHLSSIHCPPGFESNDAPNFPSSCALHRCIAVIRWLLLNSHHRKDLVCIHSSGCHEIIVK